jgi:hypothetical protein
MGLIRWARMSGPAILEAQAKISPTIMTLLHGKPAGAKRKQAA